MHAFRIGSIELTVGQVGQGSWHPGNDSLPWIRFCLKAHYFQAQTLTRRIKEAGLLWSRLEIEVERLGLHPRTMNALMDAATGRRVRNPVYRKDAAVSAQVAKRDLKLLVEAGLLVPEGERRGRVYVASQLMKELWLACRVERRISDPFAAPQSQ